ncbi:MAG: hypothetical protein Q8O67_01765 [Deltaproteobacteria bacterium]|nr:hypothetical protein [Deltaproteobacteria bacterium]
MIDRVVVVVVVAVVAACAPPPEVAPTPAGPALLFAALPDAFRFPDDDVDDATDGLQVDIVINVENADDIESVTLASGLSEASADVVDARATVRATLAIGLPPVGADNVLTASAGELSVQRAIVGLDRSEAPPPVSGSCDLSVDVVGNAIVTCSGGDPLDGDAQTLLHGGLIALRTAPVDDDANARTRMVALRGGAAQFPFAFDVDGDFVFAATLAGSTAFFGAALTASTNATVDVD